MTNPVPGHTVTTPWGIPGSWAAGRHTGQDYAANTGTPVLAAAPGTVLHVGYGGWGPAYGLHVILDHGQVQSGYMHLSTTAVRPGQRVEAGDRVGKVGTTGNSTGPHLHYEERTAPYTYGHDRRPQLPDQEDDMPLTDKDLAKIAEAVWAYKVPPTGDEPKDAPARGAGWLLRKVWKAGGKTTA
jgi:murein DD-endopeptidase MepM/ murein hydrolase activator NlpD